MEIILSLTVFGINQFRLDVVNRKYEKLSDYEKCLVDRTMGEKSKDFFSMILNGPGSNTQKCNEEDFIPDCPDGYATNDSINYCYCVADWCK